MCTCVSTVVPSANLHFRLSKNAINPPSGQQLHLADLQQSANPCTFVKFLGIKLATERQLDTLLDLMLIKHGRQARALRLPLDKGPNVQESCETKRKCLGTFVLQGANDLHPKNSLGIQFLSMQSL